MIEISINRGSTLVAKVKPTGSSNQVKKIMGDNVVNLLFDLNAIVNFQIGDTANIFGEDYYINKMPTIKKKNLYDYEYTLQMQHSQYKLAAVKFLFYDAGNNLGQGDFALTGTAETFIDLLIKNANRVSAGWTKGGVVQSEYKTLTFSNDDCLSVLAKLAKEFSTEYYVSGTQVNLAKKTRATQYAFMYGRSRGLYDIQRQQTDDPVVTRLYAFGGTKNIPADYDNFSTRLRLPPQSGGQPCLVTNVTFTVTDNGDGTETIDFIWTAPTTTTVTAVQIEYRLKGTSTFNTSSGSPTTPRSITVPVGTYEIRFRTLGGICDTTVTENITVSTTDGITYLRNLPIPYLEEHVADYGIIEGVYTNETIFPHRDGVVSSVDATNVYKFSDTSINFDINLQLLPGLAAKVTFNTGQLAGYSFDVAAFNYGTKEFTILKNKDEKNLDLPSFDLRQAIGDKYVLTDIRMPQSYINAAESELLTKAQEYLDINSVPQYKYTITCDPAYFRKKKIKMDIGDIVLITDTELQINKSIRVIGLVKSLIEEYEYTLELGETVTAGTLQTIITAQNNTASNVLNITNQLNQNALLSGNYIGNFKVSQGTLIVPDMPTGTGSPVLIGADGKLYRT